MTTLRVVQPAPAPKHWLLVGLAEMEELERWAAASVDTSLDVAARQMAATMLLEVAKRALVRLEATAAGMEMAGAFIAAKEKAR